jgi:hypothetical protein
MAEIKQSFKILFLPENILIMYSHLDDNTYTKTYDTPLGIRSEFIDIQEYASAIATLILR